jgi:hypothetical protein
MDPNQKPSSRMVGPNGGCAPVLECPAQQMPICYRIVNGFVRRLLEPCQWLSLLMTAVVIIAGYVSDALDVDTAWALGAGIVAAYAVSRGLAKAGSREGPFVVDLKGDDDGR